MYMLKFEHSLMLNYYLTEGFVKTKVNNIKVCEGEFTLISPHDMPVPRI